MIYVLLTIASFIVLSLIYGICDVYRNYLKNKYDYDIYNDNCIRLIIFFEVFIIFGIGLYSVGMIEIVCIPMITLSIISAIIAVAINISKTSFINGLLITILQIIFAAYFMLMVGILINQIKEIVSPKDNGKGRRY